MKTITILLSLCAALASGTANAEIKLADHSQILGKWSVDAEALGLDKQKRALQVTWEFLKDGTLKTVGEDRSGRIGDKMDIDIKYSVEDGLIRKQITPGREKYEDCSVLELSDKAMTLKCKFLYLFLSRK